MADGVAEGFSIGVLAARAGVTPGVLRTWENRFGFPRGRRSSSGHRRFNDADVALVLQVLEVRDSGLPLQVAIDSVVRSQEAGEELMSQCSEMMLVLLTVLMHPVHRAYGSSRLDHLDPLASTTHYHTVLGTQRHEVHCVSTVCGPVERGLLKLWIRTDETDCPLLCVRSCVCPEGLKSHVKTACSI